MKRMTKPHASLTRLHGRRIPRTVISRQTYGYRADPGHLIVDVAQGDPPAALVTNLTGRLLTITFPGGKQPRRVFLFPKGHFPRALQSGATPRTARENRWGHELPPDHSLLLDLSRVHGIVPYQALVDGAGIEVSGGSGPDIIIDP